VTRTTFKRNDAKRALQSARDGGIEPSMLDVIVGADGAVTFRVYGDKAAPLMPTPQQDAGAKEWNDEIAKLKAKATPPKAKGR
jgi:hypothetical protein